MCIRQGHLKAIQFILIHFMKSCGGEEPSKVLDLGGLSAVGINNKSRGFPPSYSEASKSAANIP